jgi:GTP-binding protein
VLVVDKTDLLGATDTARTEQWKKLTNRLQASLAQVKGIPIVGVSARTGRGVEKLRPAVVKLHAAWKKRVPTPQFNRWLGEAIERNPPPLVDGRRIKLRYGSQVKARPPTFALFVSRPADLPKSYERYLVNRLREDFDLPGTPIRIVMRKPKNLYAKG